MKVRRIVLMGLSALVAATTLTLTSASPAFAASPTCTTGHSFQGSIVYGSTTLRADFDMPAYYYSNFGEYTFACTLRYGNTGEGVKALQRSLNICASQIIGGTLSVDGRFGSQTRNAVYAVQRYWGIQVDGVYGPQTASTIEHDAWVPAGGFGDCARYRP